MLDTAARVHTGLAADLESPDGMLARLYATTRLLQRVEEGRYSPP